MRILVNAYFAKNLGDDLFLKVLFDRYPNVKWHLLTANKDYNEIFKTYKNVSILKCLSFNILGLRRVDAFSKINNLILNYWMYDGLLNIGGSIFMEAQGWEASLTRKSILPEKFNRLNKKSFIIGANFGPFLDSKFLDSHKNYFSLFEDICLRDINSYNLFKELKNVRVAPDTIFNLKVEKSVDKERIIGISVINLERRSELQKYHQEYRDKIIELIEHYIDLGYKIRLFSFCEKEGDLKMCYEIKQKIGGNFNSNVTIINYNGKIAEFLSKFKSCEIIIGTRFHSIILALLYNINVFSIIYSDKTFHVLDDLGLGEMGIPMKDIRKLKLEDIIINTKIINLEEVCSQAESQFKALDLFIGN